MLKNRNSVTQSSLIKVLRPWEEKPLSRIEIPSGYVYLKLKTRLWNFNGKG